MGVKMAEAAAQEKLRIMLITGIFPRLLLYANIWGLLC